MRANQWRPIVAGMLTAVLLDLSFPVAGPLPPWRSLFAWFALTPFLLSVLGLASSPHNRPLRRSFFQGWLTGALWYGLSDYWVYQTMHLYGNMNEAMAALCLVLFSIYLGFWFGVFALILAIVRRATIGKRCSWLGFVAIPFLWITMEFVIARIPQFPWDQLGYSQIDNALLTGLAPWTGVYGISFVLASVNALIAAAVTLGRNSQKSAGIRFPIAIYCGALAVILGCTEGLLIAPPKPQSQATAVLVQPNLDVSSDDAWLGKEWDQHMAQFAALAKSYCGHDYLIGLPETSSLKGQIQCSPSPIPPALVVWPESPAPFRDADTRFRQSVSSIARETNAPMIVGDIGMDPESGQDTGSQQYHFYNSASVITAGGQFSGRYDKIHLVPFGEYVPFRRLFFFVHQLTDQLSDTGSGSNRRSFVITSADGRTHRYGIFICYESVFADEVRQFVRAGAEVLVNISDDGWYGDTSAPWQHLNMARMRAIENRRWILRDTNSGVTAVIDPYGTVRQSIPRHVVDALPAEFGYRSDLTFYTVHGDVLPVICAILSLALLLWSVRILLWANSPKL
ncbi:apolipoprotein N-acyltransferase [Acidicapsa dinghuensis]|uniref:Apolipoprotein N-acyltransferase n=1 Tax=Acidicapsa dinghuensis TaxID=2218256 RepID=A0ABW1ELZ3_9BACT|nr:apolipoprotein N-acyltransferase [Acidicapsa dinghuensis]